MDIYAAFSTGAIKVRSSPLDQAFWYASNEPGPFYVFGERTLGDPVIYDTLGQISAQLGRDDDPLVIVEGIGETIRRRYEETPTARATLASMSSLIPPEARERAWCVSGGERRDWFFSFPLSLELHLPHAWLFKSRPPVITASNGRQAPVHNTSPLSIHAADLMNRGESFERYWLPALNSIQVGVAFAVFAIDRSTVSLNYLNDRGIGYRGLYSVDLPFFVEAEQRKIISSWTLGEIKLYLESPKKWIDEIYVPHFPGNCDFALLDEKSRPRAAAFCTSRGLPSNMLYGSKDG